MRKRGWLWLLGSLAAILLLWIGSWVWRVGRDQARFPRLVEETKEGPILFRGVDIYPGFGGALLLKKDLLIRGDKIHAIKEAGAIKAEGATLIDGSGKTLLPGFVDAHVHLGSSGSAPWDFVFGSAEHNLHAYLRAGVTTVFELGGMASLSKKLRSAIEGGTMLGPRLYFTDSPVTALGGHPIPAAKRLLPWPLKSLLPSLIYQIQTPQEAAAIVAQIQKKGVDYIKIILDELPVGSPRMSEENFRALVAEAKKRKMKVFVHIGSREEALLAASAGADVLAHGVYRGELSDQDALAIKQAGCTMIPTLYGFAVTEALARGAYHPTPFERSIHPAFLLAGIEGAAGKAFAQTPVLGDFARTLRAQKKHWKTNLQRLARAGVPLLIGTDSALPGSYPGSALHKEMQALHEAGLSAQEILAGATSKAADRIEAKPDFGRVHVGMKADLVLVRGNPLLDLRTTEAIESVFRKGRRLHFRPSP